MSAEVFSLPASATSSTVIDWRLDKRGLEWTKPDGGDRWMPFACIRLATMGGLGPQGWRLRLSGPPGAAVICSGGQLSGQGLTTFTMLARAMILGAQQAGCQAKFRLNHSQIGPGWLWARRGKKLQGGADLVSFLPNLETAVLKTNKM